MSLDHLDEERMGFLNRCIDLDALMRSLAEDRMKAMMGEMTIMEFCGIVDRTVKAYVIEKAAQEANASEGRNHD